MVRCWQIKCAL